MSEIPNQPADQLGADNHGITKQIIEGAIRKLKCRDDVTVINFATSKAASFGEGFMSCVHAVDVNIKEAESLATTSVIVKTMSTNQLIKDIVVEVGLFRKEIAFYSMVIPDLVSVAEWTPPFPRFLGGFEDLQKAEGVVILENLRPSGFKMADVKKGLNYDHCSLVVNELAKLHALSFAMIQKGNVSISERYGRLANEALSSDLIMSDDFHLELKVALANGLKLVGPALETDKEFAGKLQKIFSDISEDPLEAIKNFLVAPKERFSVICHGDIWCNNVLFKYGVNGDDKPTEVRLIDLQLWRHALPTLDLSYLMFTSTTQATRRQHLDDLLKKYLATFTATSRDAGVQADDFTIERLREMFRRTALYGVLFACDMLPQIMADKETLEEMNGFESMADWVEKAKDVMDTVDEELGALMKDRVKGVIEDAVWLGLT